MYGAAKQNARLVSHPSPGTGALVPCKERAQTPSPEGFRSVAAEGMVRSGPYTHARVQNQSEGSKHGVLPVQRAAAAQEIKPQLPPSRGNRERRHWSSPPLPPRMPLRKGQSRWGQQDLSLLVSAR